MKRSNRLLKILDTYIGIPLVFFLSAFSRKKKKIPMISSIGILKPVAIGDLTLLTAIIQDIYHQIPNVKIFVFAGHDNAILEPHIPFIHQLVVLPIKNPILALKKIRRMSLDVMIDCDSWSKISSLLTFFSKSKFKIGFRTKNQAKHFIFDKYIDHNPNIHELDNYRNLLSLINIDAKKDPCLRIKKTLKSPYSNQNYFVFHLSAGGHNHHLRQWSFFFWQKVLEFLISKDIKVFLTGSKKDKLMNQSFMQFCNKPKSLCDLAGDMNFSETLQIISQAKIVISVNTGIMHVAAALSTPVISLNGPTNINRWGAWGKSSYNLYPNEKGCGFLNLGFEYNNQRTDCMRYISPQDVINQIQKIGNF